MLCESESLKLRDSFPHTTHKYLALGPNLANLKGGKLANLTTSAILSRITEPSDLPKSSLSENPLGNMLICDWKQQKYRRFRQLIPRFHLRNTPDPKNQVNQIPNRKSRIIAGKRASNSRRRYRWIKHSGSIDYILQLQRPAEKLTTFAPSPHLTPTRTQPR